MEERETKDIRSRQLLHGPSVILVAIAAVPMLVNWIRTSETRGGTIGDAGKEEESIEVQGMSWMKETRHANIAFVLFVLIVFVLSLLKRLVDFVGNDEEDDGSDFGIMSRPRRNPVGTERRRKEVIRDRGRGH